MRRITKVYADDTMVGCVITPSAPQVLQFIQSVEIW